MHFETLKLDKSMYKAAGGFSRQLEKLDPSAAYQNTEYAGLDAFQRQLKRFDIKVSGPQSHVIAKFFSTSDSAALFPEYVSRAVLSGVQEESVLREIVAAKTDIDSLDYRSITTDLSSADFSGDIAEGGDIPETNIVLSETLVPLKKKGRLLKASYEAIKFQRIDVFSIALRQVGLHIAKAQLAGAVKTLIGAGASAAEKISPAGAALTYDDLLKLWNLFADFEMNVLLASPDMAVSILSLAEFKDPAAGSSFQNSGDLATPMGAKLIRSAAVPTGTVIGLDRRFALEMVTAGGVSVEYDKLIDTQLERAAITSIYGFSKIFPGAVKVLARP